MMFIDFDSFLCLLNNKKNSGKRIFTRPVPNWNSVLSDGSKNLVSLRLINHIHIYSLGSVWFSHEDDHNFKPMFMKTPAAKIFFFFFLSFLSDD